MIYGVVRIDAKHNLRHCIAGALTSGCLHIFNGQIFMPMTFGVLRLDGALSSGCLIPQPPPPPPPHYTPMVHAVAVEVMAPQPPSTAALQLSYSCTTTAAQLHTTLWSCSCSPPLQHHCKLTRRHNTLQHTATHCKLTSWGCVISGTPSGAASSRPGGRDHCALLGLSHVNMRRMSALRNVAQQLALSGFLSVVGLVASRDAGV